MRCMIVTVERCAYHRLAIRHDIGSFPTSVSHCNGLRIPILHFLESSGSDEILVRFSAYHYGQSTRS